MASRNTSSPKLSKALIDEIEEIAVLRSAFDALVKAQSDALLNQRIYLEKRSDEWWIAAFAAFGLKRGTGIIYEYNASTMSIQKVKEHKP